MKIAVAGTIAYYCQHHEVATMNLFGKNEK